MKPALLFSTLLLLCLTTVAQKDVPGFGKIEKADLEMKDCSFEKNAEAMVLFDVAEVYCDINMINDSWRTELERHVRIKILNTKGMDAANIHIPYLSANGVEDIKNVSAQTINLDASGNLVFTKVGKDAMYRKKINKRYSEMIFTFPDVKAGSVIEYKYKDDATDLAAVKSWYFQRSIPVELSRYILNFPTELVITAIPKGGLRVNITEDLKANRNIKTFSMQNVPALKDEAYISCDDDYLQQVTPLLTAWDFPGVPRRSLLRSWPGIIRQLMEDEDFGLQLKKNIPRTKDLDSMLENISDPHKKMVVIHGYVKKNMVWDETLGIWALDGVKAAWKSKKGTSGEINLILVNLLKDAGLDAYPVLVSTRDNGRVNTYIANFYQFNKVLAYVKINDETYVLDATDKYTPSDMVPYEVLSSEGLVIEKLDTYQWGWKLLRKEDQIFKNVVIVDADITADGKMTGEAVVTSAEYSRLERIKKMKEGKEKFAETWLNQDKQDVKIDSLVFVNEDKDSLPLIQQFVFSKKINSSGDYHYFSANLFCGLDKNPFVVDERFSDIFFGANQKYMITGYFTIPENCQFETLPKNIKMIMPDTSIVFFRTADVSGNVLSVSISLEFKQPVYSYEDYDYFKEFYKKMFDFLNEQFVFKKK